MNNKKDYIWGLLGKFIPEGVFLLTTMILARLLTPDDFGMIGVISVIFTVANTITDSGLGGSLIKEENLTNLDSSSIFCFNLCVSVFLYVIIFLGAGHIETFYNVQGLANVTRCISLMFVFNSFALVPKALLAKNIRFNILFRISTVSVIIASFISVVLAFLGAKVYAIVGYRLVLSLTTAMLAIYYSDFSISLSFSFDSLKKLLPFGIFTTMSSIVDSIYENLLTAIFGKISNMNSTGYFYQAKKTEETLTISLASTIGQVAFPILTKIRDDKDTFINETNSIFKTVVLLITPLFLIFSFFSNEIIVVMYGEQWIGAGPYLRLLLYAAVFMVMENVNRTFIKSLGKGQPIFYVSIGKRFIGALILLATMYINQNYLVQAYIFTAFVGFVLNQVAFSFLSKISIIKNLGSTFVYFVPNLVLFLVLVGVDACLESLIVKIIFCICLCLLYYIVVGKVLGVNLYSFLKKTNK